MPLTREDYIEESIKSYVRDRLADYSYDGTAGTGNVIVREDFPSTDERAQELLTTTVAIAISFDDGGRSLELGSNFTLYTHTVECWVFATSPRIGRNLVNTIKEIIRHDGEIPVLDVTDPHKPVIDSLFVERAASAHQMNSSPRPWDQNVWTCTVRIQDEVMP